MLVLKIVGGVLVVLLVLAYLCWDTVTGGESR